MNIHEVVFLGFKAVATDENGQEYDASFMISFPAGSVDGKQVQYMVDQETKRFREYHPTGKIVQHLQKSMMVHSQ